MMFAIFKSNQLTEELQQGILILKKVYLNHKKKIQDGAIISNTVRNAI